MKLDPILSKAVSLARKKKYDEAISTLESEVNRYYGSFNFYYLLGLSYLHSKIFGVALTYFRQAREQKMRDPNTLLGLAALYLNHGDTDKAVDLYLEVQSIDSSNIIASRALKIIRKNPGPEAISAWIDSGALHTLFPGFPSTDLSRKKLTLLVMTGILALGLVLGIAINAGVFSSGGRRSIPAEISLTQEERDAPFESGGSYRFVLTRNQVLDDYNEARKLFVSYRDEAARVKLNRILESNAPEPVKNRARLLVSYMEVPGFNTLKDKFSYSDVVKDPFLYRNCHVIWRGMASNIVVQQNKTSFDFLVGYDTRRTMEGIVHVEYDFAIPVNPERPVEILGRVIPVSGDKGVEILIQGVALNQAGLLE